MTPDNLEILIGVFVPLVVSVLKKANWAPTANAVIAIAVYAATGIVGVAVQGQPFDLNNIVPSVATFTGIGTIAYQLFWKNWGDEQIKTTILP